MEECASEMKSVLTTSSSVYASTPLSGPSAAFLIVSQISAYGALSAGDEPRVRPVAGRPAAGRAAGGGAAERGADARPPQQQQASTTTTTEAHGSPLLECDGEVDDGDVARGHAEGHA